MFGAAWQLCRVYAIIANSPFTGWWNKDGVCWWKTQETEAQGPERKRRCDDIKRSPGDSLRLAASTNLSHLLTNGGAMRVRSVLPVGETTTGAQGRALSPREWHPRQRLRSQWRVTLNPGYCLASPGGYRETRGSSEGCSGSIRNESVTALVFAITELPFE
jgi:hypothetical protein